MSTVLSLLADRDRLWDAVEELRQKALDATWKETEARDTYQDGYSAGLLEALRIMRRGEVAARPVGRAT